MVISIDEHQHNSILHRGEEDGHTEDDTTSLETSSGGSRLIVVVPAILSREWSRFSDKTNRNLNQLYGNSVRVQLQTNLQFVRHSVKPNTFSKRLMIVLVSLCGIIGVVTAPFVFWSVSVYSFGMAVLVLAYLLLSRECSKSSVQKHTLAIEKIRQLCSKLNDKHSHKVLVVFNGTDLYFFSTKVEAKAPIKEEEDGVSSNDPSHSNKHNETTEPDADVCLPIHSSQEEDETNEEPKETPSDDTLPFVASWSPGKFDESIDETTQSINSIFRWKPKEEMPASKLPSPSPSSAVVEDIEAQQDDTIPSKQLLIAREAEPDNLEFVCVGMLTPWVLPLAPSHVNAEDVADAADDIAIRTLQTDDSPPQSNARHSILQALRKSLQRET